MAESKLEFKIDVSARVAVEELRRLQEETRRTIVQLESLRGGQGPRSAELEGAYARLAQLNGQLAGLGAGGRLKGELLSLGQSIPGVGRVMAALNGAAGALSVGFLGLSATIAGAARALREYAAAEQTMAGLDAALAQRGQFTEEYRHQLQELAQQMQETTAIAATEWLGVLQRLVQFGANPDQIEKYANAVKNLAGILGGDIHTAANLVSRALQGNFELFGRYGIRITETGDKVRDLDALMRMLAQRGGGVLEQQARTLTGQLTNLKHSLSDVWQALGRGLARTQVVQNSLAVLTELFAGWARALGGPIDQVGELTNKVGDLHSATTAAAPRVQSLAAAMADTAAAAKTNHEALGGLIQNLDLAARSSIELADAQRQLALARIAASDASDEEKARQTAAIEAGFSAQKFAALQQADAAKIAALQQAQEEDLASLSKLRAARAKQAAVVPVATDLDLKETKAAQQLHQAAAAKWQAQDVLRRAQANREKVVRETLPGLPAPTGPYDKAIRDAEQQLATAERALQEARVKQAAVRSEKEAHGVRTAAEEQATLADLDKAVAEAEQNLVQKGAERNRQIARLEEASRQRAALRPLETEKEQVDAERAAREARAKDEAEKKRQRDEQARAEREAQIRLLRAQAEATPPKDRTPLLGKIARLEAQALQEQNAPAEALQAFWQEFANQLTALREQIANEATRNLPPEARRSMRPVSPVMPDEAQAIADGRPLPPDRPRLQIAEVPQTPRETFAAAAQVPAAESQAAREMVAKTNSVREALDAALADNTVTLAEIVAILNKYQADAAAVRAQLTALRQRVSEMVNNP